MAKAVETVDQRLFTVEEYHRMAESGVFQPDERLELIRGVVRRVSPKNYAHVVTVAKIIKRLTTVLAERASIYPEAPLKLVGLDSEPEPDVMVTSSPIPEDYGKTTTLIVIEVAESSLGYDLNVKALLYAEAAIPEYWVVNVVDRELVVFREPRDGVYEERRAYRSGDRIQPLAWQDIVIEFGDLFPNLDPA